MAFDGVKNFNWKNFFITNLTGIVCALGLAALVSAVCGYNFFLMLLIFLAMYFVVGIAIEYLMVVLYLEKADGSMKKKKGEPTLPNRKAALKYMAACNMKVGNLSDLVKKDSEALSLKSAKEEKISAETSQEGDSAISEKKPETEIGDAEEKNKK